MINPADLTDAVVTALQSIPDLVTAMNGEQERIYAHHYLYGQDNRFAQALYKLNPPVILVAWEGTDGGDFNGEVIWKHRIACYLRSTNMANVDSPTSYEYLFWLIVNGPVFGLNNLRYTNVLPTIDIMDTPQAVHLTDDDNMDYFKIEMVFPEIGDT